MNTSFKRINVSSKTFIILLACICNSSALFSLNYGIADTHKSIEKISNFFVIGERCSGTNYLTSLIKKNTQLVERAIGHKHFPPWYELGPEHFHGDPRYYNFTDTQNFLFLVIFRDPYDWARSIHRLPHHAQASLWHIPFSSFIRSKWLLDRSDSVITSQKNPLVDLNPKDGLPFKNVFALRSAKIETMLEIYNRAPNVYIINYETVRDYPEEVLKEIAYLYHLELKTPFTSIDTYKGENEKTYEPQAYKAISDIDLEYINSQLDQKLEDLIGYKI